MPTKTKTKRTAESVRAEVEQIKAQVQELEAELSTLENIEPPDWEQANDTAVLERRYLTAKAIPSEDGRDDRCEPRPR